MFVREKEREQVITITNIPASKSGSSGIPGGNSPVLDEKKTC